MMLINTNIVENSHHLDALIKAARACPTFSLRQKLIDAEIDGQGKYVGFADATQFWLKALPDGDLIN